MYFSLRLSELSRCMRRGRTGFNDEQIVQLVVDDGEANGIFGSSNEGSRSSTDELLYGDDGVIVGSQSVDLGKVLMKRLLRLHKLLKSLVQRIEALALDDHLPGQMFSGVNSEENLDATLALLQQYDELHFFLWGRLTKMLYEEHQRCSDAYASTLNMHDRLSMEYLSYSIHHNTVFCNYMGEIVDRTLGRDTTPGRVQNEALQEALTQHTKNMEKIQILATYSALLVVEVSRESFLDPVSMQDLCRVVVEEKNRRKRLIALSLMFGVLDQDEQAIGEALIQQLPRLLLQRIRHLVHRIFGYPEKPASTFSRMGDRSPFRYYSAVIQSDTNSPISSRKASPEINGQGVTAIATVGEIPLPSLTKGRAKNNIPLSESQDRVHSPSRAQIEGSLLENGERALPERQRGKTVYDGEGNDENERYKKVRCVEGIEESISCEKNFENWKPKKGDKVGRGPAWGFDNQGEPCDFGEVVEITTGEEVLVRWLLNVDSTTENGINDRIFRYTYKKPHEQIVSWSRFLNMHTIRPESINFKLEEFTLNCAVVGAICSQREAVLPALQFQTVETMIHVLDSVDLADASASALRAEKDSEKRERAILGNEEEDGAVDEDALETRLHWDAVLHLAKEHHRQVREIVARVGWVLSALLSHKKIALIFLELDGLRQIMKLIRGDLEAAMAYGCCMVLSQLARGVVFENLLRNHGMYFEPIMRFVMHQWKDSSCHDVQGSAGGFLFHALSFPCVVSLFDSHQGTQTTLGTIERLLKSSEERFDVLCPGLILAGLKCLYVYMVSHLMLSTRVIFRKHRFLSVLVTNSTPERSLPRDPATVESVLSLLSAVSVPIPDISVETVQCLLARDRLVAVRSMVDDNVHQLLLRCAQFYFTQSRWDLLAASLNVLCVLAVVPFARPLIADARYPESGIVHLIMIVSELTAAFQSGNSSRESHLIPCAATALQILLYLTAPPVDKNDEAAISTFNRVCSMIRASDGVRTLLDVLRFRKDAPMSAKLQIFPVVARALQLMVTLRRYADTSLLFDALGVSTVVRELLTQYEDVQKEYISMMGPRYAAGEVHATGRFMENVLSFLFDGTKQVTPTISVDPVEFEKRQAIIARSHITYSHESLLELISRHLEAEGLQNAASVLRHDARISSENPLLQQSNNATTDVTMISTIGAPTLDSIICSYLRQQHERCTNPITTLPQFDLRKNHVYYPLPAPVDQTRNTFNRRLAQKMGVDFSLRMSTNDNHLAYRYPGHLFDITGSGDGLQGDSIAFCDAGETLVVGTSEGAIALFDTFPDETSGDKLLEQHLAFDGDEISGIFVSTDGAFLAVVSADHTVGVMKRDQLPVIQYRVEGSRAATFSNSNNHLLTTCDEQHTCRLYDIVAQRELHHFSDPSWVGENLDNVATFDSSSRLILSDAILWDIRCSDKPIYRFDRFTESFCNIFHPLYPLVLIDEKVWDLRTLTMLQTVPSFKKTNSFHINPFGQVIYSFREASSLTNSSCSVLSVVEGYTFETVFSTEVRPSFKAFAIDPSDRYCAAILEGDIDTVVRMFSTSSGPLPGQQSFPLPQDDDTDGSEVVLTENEDEDDLSQDSFWSSAGDNEETEDDDDENEEESELSYTDSESDTGSYETDDNRAALASREREYGTEEVERSEETTESVDTSMSST